jgi:hypothetical protein
MKLFEIVKKTFTGGGAKSRASKMSDEERDELDGMPDPPDDESPDPPIDIKAWIHKMYEKYPANPMNRRQHCIVYGEGDDQTFGIFELEPSCSAENAVEIKWFQAYPLRTGTGAKAMRELQAEAQKAGVTLTLFPWEHGRISQAGLIKFYKKQGFELARKGGKDMIWHPH